ncbi:MAG: hypothetical protein AAFQ82_08945 [Myxococcota bacterium]
MSEQTREWQLAWHDLFDIDQTLADAGEFWRPDPIPDELDRDYRLIFGLSQAERATRNACFALLPKGAEMATRFDDFLRSTPRPMAEAEARALLAEVEELLPGFRPHEEVDFNAVTVVDRETTEGAEALRRTDDILYVLEGTAADPYRSADPTAIAAYSFLTEPLYASCGNFYHLRDWVTGLLFDPNWDRLQHILFRLWDGGWQVRVSDDGVVFARRNVGPTP